MFIKGIGLLLLIETAVFSLPDWNWVQVIGTNWDQLSIDISNQGNIFVKDVFTNPEMTFVRVFDQNGEKLWDYESEGTPSWTSPCDTDSYSILISPDGGYDYQLLILNSQTGKLISNNTIMIDGYVVQYGKYFGTINDVSINKCSLSVYACDGTFIVKNVSIPASMNDYISGGFYNKDTFVALLDIPPQKTELITFDSSSSNLKFDPLCNDGYMCYGEFLQNDNLIISNGPKLSSFNINTRTYNWNTTVTGLNSQPEVLLSSDGTKILISGINSNCALDPTNGSIIWGCANGDGLSGSYVEAGGFLFAVDFQSNLIQVDSNTGFIMKHSKLDPEPSMLLTNNFFAGFNSFVALGFELTSNVNATIGVIETAC